MAPQVWATVRTEFSDLGDLSDVTRICVRLAVALLLGALLGYERESAGSAAGLRTHMLVSLGAAAGIGFLGAGAILKLRDEDQIKGLTTAAGIWVTAAIGIAAGMGMETTAILSAVLGWSVLAMVRLLDRR